MSSRPGVKAAIAAAPAGPATPLTRAQQADAGAAARGRIGRKALGAYAPAADRPDPISIIERQDAHRVPELVPIRHGRMLVSPFTFYRGAAAIMAGDLGAAPDSGLGVQLSGDAHLSNFGVFASPERTLVFDLTDFDESLPGPFEWDVKRLVTSFVVAGRSFAWRKGLGTRAATYAVGSYRLRMQEYAASGVLSTWYSRIALEDLRAYFPRDRQVTIDLMIQRAHARDNLGALNKLTVVVDGRHQFIDKPPLMVRVVDEADRGVIADILRGYRATLTPERQRLLDRYTFVDLARKVVGVGSVGTQCWVAYFHGADENDPLFLQLKEAQESVLEPYLGRAFERHHGHRVVNGQRSMQASTTCSWAGSRVPPAPTTTGASSGTPSCRSTSRPCREAALIAFAPGVRLGARPGARALRQPDRHRRLHGHERPVRAGDDRVRGGVRDPDRARPRRDGRGGPRRAPPGGRRGLTPDQAKR